MDDAYFTHKNRIVIMRVIVAGGRDFDDYSKLKTVLDETLSGFGAVEIISGHARGADMLGERYASENKIPCKLFPADWKRFHIRARFIRNTQMIEYAMQETPLVIAFWNGISHCTMDTIEKAKKANIKCVVIHYDSKPMEPK